MKASSRTAAPRRILLVCPEPLGHGQPAGVGIRFVEMARVLRDDGHDVTVLSPDAGTLPGCRGDFINPEALFTHSEASDVAVVQGHVANAFFMQATPIPTVADLYDPFIVENLHYYAERGAEVFTHDHFTLMTSLLRGDFFLCASEAQRMFYLGQLLAVGRLNPILFESDPRLEGLIRIAPFGVQPPRDLPQRDLEAPNLLFGGIYDWYDPITAIEAVALAREAIPSLTLTFNNHPNPDTTPQGKVAEALEHIRERGHDFVRFEPWVPYHERAEFFDRFALALLTFPRSIETDLAMRTRIYDYLWCGLPIVTSSAPGTDEILERYGAGSVIPSDVPEAYAKALLDLLQHRGRYAAMTRGTEQFVRDHQWQRALAPLREFCAAPAFDATKESFAMRPSIPERPPSFLDRLRRRLRA
jgi:glycosyltransferase involved in cell wall biosynthesis